MFLGGASKGIPLRVPGFALFVLLFASHAGAQDVRELGDISDTLSQGADYQLGGAVHAVRSPTKTIEPLQLGTRLRLSVPRLIRETQETIRRTAIGGLRVYFGEAWNEGQDIFQLGTALTNGSTTAGVSVTYEDDTRALASSELYLDYAITDRFSVGVSGLMNDDVTEGDDQVPQFGVNAEINAANGAFLKGGIADSANNKPIFGLAIGLRF